MTRREELVKQLAANLARSADWTLTYEQAAERFLDAILPQVTTVAELEALPDGSVVMGAQGITNRWHSSIGAEGFIRVTGVPLTVVWQPEVTA